MNDHRCNIIVKVEERISSSISIPDTVTGVRLQSVQGVEIGAQHALSENCDIWQRNTY
jgi:hypothetical protein